MICQPSMKHIFVLLFVMGVTLRCKKETLPIINCSDKTNDMASARMLISGTYTWAYTIVQMRGTPTFIESPATTGLNYRYVFKKNGTVDYYENDAFVSRDNYVVDYEFKVTSLPSDSATVVIIKDKQTGQRKEFFRPWLCNDSARFNNPYNSVENQRYFKRD